MTYDNTNRGAIWGNNQKAKDTDPDYTGSVNVEGVEYWVNGWKRGPDANPKSPAMKFSIKMKQGQPPRHEPAPQQPAGFDDDIGF